MRSATRAEQPLSAGAGGAGGTSPASAVWAASEKVGQQMWSRVWSRLSALRHERGQDMAEYALLIAFIAIVAFVGVNALGGIIKTTFYDRFRDILANVLVR
jgi:Flp pilus assembly pilin Flp